jgi:hypothetical protein
MVQVCVREVHGFARSIVNPLWQQAWLREITVGSIHWNHPPDPPRSRSVSPTENHTHRSVSNSLGNRFHSLHSTNAASAGFRMLIFCGLFQATIFPYPPVCQKPNIPKMRINLLSR